MLNVNVRLNIVALERLLSRFETVAPAVRDEREELLASEQLLAVVLRLICCTTRQRCAAWRT